MDDRILFTIIMPTYNSEKTIEKALKSIREQDLPRETVELLVIDGGSTDRTVEIALEYGAVILNNPQRFPEYAKRIGLTKAKGRWAVMQDSDEVLVDKSQLRKRIEFFEENPDVYCVMLDKFIPGEHCGIACAYVNWFGDPFSYCVYHLSESRVKRNRKYLVQESRTGNVYFYTKDDIIPIADAGTTTIDIRKAKEIFGEEYYAQEFAVSIFQNMVCETGFVGCIPEDSIIHYSNADFRAYLRKIKFRVYTNLNDVKQSGYSLRARKNKKLRRRKVVFIVYCVTIVLPLLDSIRMCIEYKRPSLLLHFIYTYYVVLQLFVGICKKIFRLDQKGVRYG